MEVPDTQTPQTEEYPRSQPETTVNEASAIPPQPVETNVSQVFDSSTQGTLQKPKNTYEFSFFFWTIFSLIGWISTIWVLNAGGIAGLIFFFFPSYVGIFTTPLAVIFGIIYHRRVDHKRFVNSMKTLAGLAILVMFAIIASAIDGISEGFGTLFVALSFAATIIWYFQAKKSQHSQPTTVVQPRKDKILTDEEAKQSLEKNFKLWLSWAYVSLLPTWIYGIAEAFNIRPYGNLEVGGGISNLAIAGVLSLLSIQALFAVPLAIIYAVKLYNKIIISKEKSIILYKLLPILISVLYMIVGSG